MIYAGIGDIHGELGQLKALMAAVKERHPVSQTIFLGDYIDRGPDAKGVISEVRDHVKNGAIALMGNHEDMILESMIHNGRDWFLPENGCLATIQSYIDGAVNLDEIEENEKFVEEIEKFYVGFCTSGHFEFLRGLPLFHETEEYFFSHAPIPKCAPATLGVFRANKEILLWSIIPPKEIERKYFTHPGRFAVCGHQHRGKTYAKIFPGLVFADSGCGCIPGAPLSAVILDGGIPIEIIESHPGAIIKVIEVTNEPGIGYKYTVKE